MRKWSFCLWFLFVAGFIHAQSYKLAVGAYGEGHLGFIANQNNYGYSELRYGVHPFPGGGIRIGYPIDDHRQLQAGLAYHLTGQTYLDNIAGLDNRKTITLNYIQLPVFWKKTLSIIDHWIGNTGQTYWYRTHGLILNALQHANVDWSIDDNPVSMLEFINATGQNPHSSLLISRGNPDSYKELFSFFDVSLGVGGGMDHYFNEQLHLSVELLLQFGLLDVNHNNWRLTNPSGEYGSSHQLSLGLQVGIWYDVAN